MHEMHLGQPQGVEAEPIGLLGLRNQLGITIRRILTGDGRQLVEKIELHDIRQLRCGRMAPSGVRGAAPRPPLQYPLRVATRSRWNTGSPKNGSLKRERLNHR